MGLDIYFYKTNLMQDSNDIAEVHNADNEKAEKDFAETFHKNFKRLQMAAKGESYVSDEKYAKAYNKLTKAVSKFFNYDLLTEELNKGVQDLSFVNDWHKKAKIHIYAIESIYYRKVNFVYEFFSTNAQFVDECCWVTKSMVEDLIEKCDEVLKHKDEASVILPTTSGFFFGSTDYDEWYYNDVKEVRKDFKKLLRGWKDDERVYAVFSW